MNVNIFSVDRLLPKSGALGETPTTAQAYKDVGVIAGPAVAEMVLMSVVGAVDTMMVGVLGKEAVAAVGLVDQPRMLLMSVFLALNIGVTAIVARRKGEGRQEDANKTLRNAVVFALGLSLVMMIVGLSVSRQLMQMIGAQPDTIDNANMYFRIMIYAIPVNALTLCICAAQRGVGNTKITMYVNITSNVVNLALDAVLIEGKLGFPRLEVAGDAYSTVIGFVVGLIMCLITVWRRKGSYSDAFLSFSLRDDWRMDRKTMGSILKIGSNAMIEQIALRLGFFIYAGIVARLGTLAFAAHQICMKFLSISFTVGDGIGIAGTSLVGQMLGKKRPDLAQMYGKAAQRIALVSAIVIASCIALFRLPLVTLFIRDDAGVISLASKVMLCVALFQPLQTTAVVMSGALRGAGDNRFVAGVMLCCVTIIRPVCALIAINVIQNTLGRPDIALIGCWLASLFDMSIRMTLVYRRFNGGKWHDIKV